MSDQNDTIEKCRTGVARLMRAQDQLKLKDGAFVARFRDSKNGNLLSTPRTWERMRKNEWAQGHLNPEKWLSKINQAVAQLDGNFSVAEVYEDMPFFKLATARLNQLVGQTNDRRCLLILAPTGNGKSVFCRHHVDRKPGERTYIRCKPMWRNQDLHICHGIYRKLTGEKLLTGSSDAALGEIIEFLEAAKRTLFFDEAHDGGIALMKIIKQIIDETSTCVVYAGYPTTYQTMVNATTGAAAEARQFLGRCMKPIMDEYRFGTGVKDVAHLLKREGFGETAMLAKDLTPVINRREGLRTLVDAIEIARKAADEADIEQPTADMLEQAMLMITGESRPAARGDEE